VVRHVGIVTAERVPRPGGDAGIAVYQIHDAPHLALERSLPAGVVIVVAGR
jgi:hypothetical protein